MLHYPLLYLSFFPIHTLYCHSSSLHTHPHVMLHCLSPVFPVPVPIYTHYTIPSLSCATSSFLYAHTLYCCFPSCSIRTVYSFLSPFLLHIHILGGHFPSIPLLLTHTIFSLLFPFLNHTHTKYIIPSPSFSVQTVYTIPCPTHKLLYLFTFLLFYTDTHTTLHYPFPAHPYSTFLLPAPNFLYLPPNHTNNNSSLPFSTPRYYIMLYFQVVCRLPSTLPCPVTSSLLPFSSWSVFSCAEAVQSALSSASEGIVP